VAAPPSSAALSQPADDLRLDVLALGLCSNGTGAAMIRSAVGRVREGARRGQVGLIDPLVSCGLCAACSQGKTNECSGLRRLYDSFGEAAPVLDAPAVAFVTLPQGLEPNAACLVEPLARGWHRARLTRRAFPQGRTALVIGDTAEAVGAALSLRAQGIDTPHLVCLTEGRAGFLRTRSRLALRDAAAVPGQGYDLVLNCAGPEQDHFAIDCLATEGALARGPRPASDKAVQEGIADVQTSGYTAQDFIHVTLAAGEGRLGRLKWVDTAPLSDLSAQMVALARQQSAAPMLCLTVG